MSVTFDEQTGILRSTVKGMHTERDSAAFMADFKAQAAIARARTGRVLHLVDAREASVQPTTTTDAYAARAAIGDVTADKVATILSSALLRMQTQRAFPDTAIFTDPDAALAWLLADAPADSAAA